MFQSAPRSEPRGDSATRTTRPHRARFNPRPGANPGATSGYKASTTFLSVSIRAPERTPGRLGDRANVVGAVDGFNPRPGANPGATLGGVLLDHAFEVSIRAPERTPGRLADTGGWRGGQHVSIRAPERTPGRQEVLRCSLIPTWFQSAPRSEPRGDCGPANMLSRSDLLAGFREPGQFRSDPFV